MIKSGAPSARWTAQPLREAFPFTCPPMIFFWFTLYPRLTGIPSTRWSRIAMVVVASTVRPCAPYHDRHAHDHEDLACTSSR